MRHKRLPSTRPLRWSALLLVLCSPGALCAQERIIRAEAGAEEAPPTVVPEVLDTAVELHVAPDAALTPADDRGAAPGADVEPSIAQPADDAAAFALPEASQELRAASFQGLEPGRSTRADVLAVWGAPLEVLQHDGLAEHRYQIEPFAQTQVFYQDQRVLLIVLQLHGTLPPGPLIQELGLSASEPVEVLDDEGQPRTLLFPEQGVEFLLRAAQGSREVAQVSLLPISAEHFLRRVAVRRTLRPLAALGDLATARALAPQDDRPAAAQAELLLQVGRHDAALAAAQAATELSPSPENRLLLAQALYATGDYSAALAECQSLLQHSERGPALAAAVTTLSGDILAARAPAEAEAALELHVHAIELAAPLRQQADPAVRRQAERALIAAHLGAARAIAGGPWDARATAVAQWLARACQLATAAVRRDDLDESVRIETLCSALQLAGACDDACDPAPWLEPTVESGRAWLESSEDPLFRAAWNWKLGLALASATQALAAQDAAERALQTGALAEAHLKQGGVGRTPTPRERLAVGCLSWRVGRLLETQGRDAAETLTWYERADRELSAALPGLTPAEIGRQAEALVSIGVTYWATNRQDAALRVTSLGAGLFEQAVQSGALRPQSLVVPYENLAAIHQFLQDEPQAAHYAALAQQAAGEVRQVSAEEPITP